MNARNLLYVRPLNSKKAIRLADSKLKTKQFLSTRGIPVPKLLATIRSRAELAKFDFSQLPPSCVLKPDAGYGGQGIIVLAEKINKTTWRTISGREITAEELAIHIGDILDGKFSIASLPDAALFEERIISRELIPGLPVSGLPDIRVIVFNLVPVMAMLRLPTPESEGKANLMAGGAALGLDLASGETTHGLQYYRSITQFKNGVPVAGHRLPHWEQILAIASQAQLHTNLGYLAVDIVLTDRGPVLIEVNARAGLSVQLANRAGLRARLDRVAGLTVASPTEGVQLARQLFGRKNRSPKKKTESEKIIVGTFEPAEIVLPTGTHRIRAELQPGRTESVIDAALARKLKLADIGSASLRLKIRLGGRRIQLGVAAQDLSGNDYKLILAGRDLAGFLIDPFEKREAVLPRVRAAEAKEKTAAEIDAELALIDSSLKILAHIRPANLAAERKIFFDRRGEYEPQFHYRPLKIDPIAIRQQLRGLSFPDSALGQLLAAKASEIARKLDLLAAIGTENFPAASVALYGLPTEQTQQAARDRIASIGLTAAPEKTIDAAGAKEKIEQLLASIGLENWQVLLHSSMLAVMTVDKRGKIFIRAGALFDPAGLAGLLMHEIGTHVFRAANGARQPYYILRQGTQKYLQAEEGLAIWNQELVLPSLHPRRASPARNALAVAASQQLSFASLYRWMLDAGELPESAFAKTMNIKRGLGDTGRPGGFTKGHVYFSGYLEIAEFLESGGDLGELYLGKVSPKDLSLIRQLPGLVPPKYLPNQLETALRTERLIP